MTAVLIGRPVNLPASFTDRHTFDVWAATLSRARLLYSELEASSRVYRVNVDSDV